MFNGEEDYKTSYTFGSGVLNKPVPEPKPEVKGEPVEPVYKGSVKPPSAESMLKKMRQKIKGKGLKEI